MDGYPYQSFGGGGSIPVLHTLQKIYPETQIAVFGILGMDSNAHGPNEKINLAYTKKFTKAMTYIIQ
jgi:di/tripeptidase